MRSPRSRRERRRRRRDFRSPGGEAPLGAPTSAGVVASAASTADSRLPGSAPATIGSMRSVRSGRGGRAGRCSFGARSSRTWRVSSRAGRSARGALAARSAGSARGGRCSRATRPSPLDCSLRAWGASPLRALRPPRSLSRRAPRLLPSRSCRPTGLLLRSAETGAIDASAARSTRPGASAAALPPGRGRTARLATRAQWKSATTSLQPRRLEARCRTS